MIHSIVGEGRETPLFLSTISNHSVMFSLIFAAFYLRLLPFIIKPSAWNCQLLNNEIYQPLEIRNFISLVGIIVRLLTADFNSYQLASSTTTNETTNRVK